MTGIPAAAKVFHSCSRFPLSFTPSPTKPQLLPPIRSCPSSGPSPSTRTSAWKPAISRSPHASSRVFQTSSPQIRESRTHLPSSVRSPSPIPLAQNRCHRRAGFAFLPRTLLGGSTRHSIGRPRTASNFPASRRGTHQPPSGHARRIRPRPRPAHGHRRLLPSRSSQGHCGDAPEPHIQYHFGKLCGDHRQLKIFYFGIAFLDCPRLLPQPPPPPRRSINFNNIN